MARRGDLPDLSAQLPGLQRRRHRRPQRHHPPAAAYRRPRRRRDLDLALLQIADEGFRLRRHRLLRRRPDVRHARRFRRAGRRSASARAARDDRFGHLAHLRRASLVQGKPGEPRQCQGRLVRLGRRPSRTARRPTTGCRSSAARPGNGTRAAANITCTISSPSSRTSISTTAPCRTRCSRPSASGSSAASTVSASTRSTSTSTRPGSRTIRRCRKASATTRSRRRSTPTISRIISTTRAGRRTSSSCAASAPCSTNIRPSPRSAKSATRSAGWRSSPHYTAGSDRVQMCYSFDFLGPEKLSAGKVRSILETFGKVAQRRLVVLGAVQPRRGAPRHPLGQGRAGQARPI